MAQRRTPRRSPQRAGRPAGRSGPGGTSQRGIERRIAARERRVADAQVRAEEKQRSRLTGRAAILVLVLAVLAVSYASSLRAYLQLRAQIDASQAEIDRSKVAIDDFEDEIARWDDPAYVAQQARLRFGYVAKGETPYVVVDENGNPLDASAALGDPSTVTNPDERTWYADVWDSTKIAGNPPAHVPDPQDEIQAPKEDLEK